MLPAWMQKSLPNGSTSVLPSKAELLRRALIGANIKEVDTRDRSKKIYDSVTDASSKFVSSVNSVIGSAFDVLPGEPIQTFRENANYLDRNVSAARKKELEKQTEERSKLDSSDYLGRAKLYAQQQWRNPLSFAAEAAGNIAPFVAIAPIAVAAGASAGAIAVGEGAVFGAGAVRGGIYDQVLGTSDKDLMSDKDYASLRSRGVPENEAKKQVANKLASYGEAGGKIALGGIVGGLMGKLGANEQMVRVLSGQVRNAASKSAIEELASQSMLKAAAKSLGRESSTEAVQEGFEQYSSNKGAAAGGANIDPSEGVVESMVGAGLMAGLPGALAGSGEVQQARGTLDVLNKSRLTESKSDPLASVVAPAMKEIPKIAYSAHPEIADGPEAIIFNGYLESGMSPYNSLVSAGYEANQDTVKTANKVAKKVIPIARETKNIRAEVKPAIDAAVAEVNAPVVVQNTATAEPGPAPDVNAAGAISTEARDRDWEKAVSGFNSKVNNPEPVAPEVSVIEEPVPSLDEEANAKLDEIEAANPEVAPYTPGTRNKSEIWRPEINPVIAPTVQPSQSMVPSQLELPLESTPKLELVEDRNPLEDIPNQSQIYKQPVQSALQLEAPVTPQALPIAEISTQAADAAEYAANANAGTEDALARPASNASISYNYNGESIDVTPDQKANLDLIDEMGEEENPKRAARLRRFVLDRLTDADKEMIAEREAKNYHGKTVSVDGKIGEIYANPGGRVSVKFTDGTKATVAKDKVKFAGNPMEHLYSRVPTHSDHANIKPGLLQLVWDFYNGIAHKKRESMYDDRESKPSASIGNTGMIVYNPDDDMSENVIKSLSKQVELSRSLRNAMIHISQASGVTTAKFNGLSGSGRFWGINRTTSPNGKVYINPILIAQWTGFNVKETARELVNTIIHELAHEVKDTGDHTVAIFQKEMERIINSLGPATIAELESYVARSLDMNALRAMSQEQQVLWDHAFSIGYDIVNGRFGEADVKRVSLRSINERKTGVGDGEIGVSNDEAGRSGDLGKSAKDSSVDRTSELSRDGREGSVSERSVKETKRMAPRSDSGAGNGATDPNPNSPAERNSFELPQWKWWHDLTQTWVNKYNRIDQITRHLGDMARSLTPRSAELIKENNAILVKPIERLLGKNERKLEELDLYARAMQAEIRNETIRKRGGPEDGATMSTRQAKEILKRFENDKVIKEAHAMLMAITAQQRKVLLDSGLLSFGEISKAEQDMGPYYVPLHSEEVDAGFGNFASGIQVRGPEWQRATGTTGPVKNVVSAAIEQLNRSIVRSQHNAFMQDLADFVKNNDSDAWELDKKAAPSDKMVDFKVDGETHRIYISDRILRNQIQGMKPVELAAFISAMRGFTGLYSKLSTKWNPIFPITNFIRDTPMGIARVFTNEGAAAAADVFKGIPEALKASWSFRNSREKPDSKLTRMESRAKQLLLSGGVPSWTGMQDAATIKSDIEKNVIAMSKKHGVKNEAMKAATAMATAVTNVQESVETGIRLSYFDYLMKIEEERLKKNFRDQNKGNKEILESMKDKTFIVDEKKVLEIASKVRALTGDFQSQGTVSRYMGAFYPFFNASVQGIRAIGQLAVKAGKGDKRAISVFATLAAVGMMEDMIGSAVSGDDDDDGISNYDSIPDWLKRQKYIIPAGDGKSVVIPMTYGLSMAVNAGKLMSRLSRGMIKPGDFAREMFLATSESSNPLGGSETLTQMVSPVQTDWMVQIAENKDWRGNRLFPNRYPGQEWKPNSEIVANKDSELSKSIARMLNEYTGGNEMEKGMLSKTPFGDITPYPGAIDATARWAGGGLGRLMGSILSTGAKVVSGEDIDRIPFVSTFVVSPDAYFYRGRFYEQLSQLKQIRAMASGLQAKSRRDELIAKYPEKKKIIEAMNATDLKKSIPTIASNEELKKNFARIGVKKLALSRAYDEAAKKIKRMEDADTPGKEERILEIVKALNRKYTEALN